MDRLNACALVCACALLAAPTLGWTESPLEHPEITHESEPEPQGSVRPRPYDPESHDHSDHAHGHADEHADHVHVHADAASDADHADNAQDAHDHDATGHAHEHGQHAHEEDSSAGAAINVLTVVGKSSVDDAELEAIQGGGHDPLRSGLSLQQVELALKADFGGELSGAAFLVHGETEMEIEEAYIDLTSKDSARLRAGHFYAPFGLQNQRHPHSWGWIDQPLIATRLLGSEGTRSLGGRLDFALGHDWDSRFSLAVMQADDDTAVSFQGRGHVHGEDEHHHSHHEHDEGEEHDEDEEHEGEEHEEESIVELLEEVYGGLTVGNRPLIETGGLLYAARLGHAWDAGKALRYQLGASALYGPNASGPDSSTLLLGADISLRWQPQAGQWPFVLWETEAMHRSFDAAAVFNDSEPDEVIDLPAETLTDRGWYTQVLYGFSPQWAAGLRYESASGSGDSLGGTDLDPLRAGRRRVSPLLAWYSAEEELRVRLQYNRDMSDHLAALGDGAGADSVWLGIDFTFGDHHHHDDPGLSAVEAGITEHAEKDAPGHADHGGHGH